MFFRFNTYYSNMPTFGREDRWYKNGLETRSSRYEEIWISCSCKFRLALQANQKRFLIFTISPQKHICVDCFNNLNVLHYIPDRTFQNWATIIKTLWRNNKISSQQSQWSNHYLFQITTIPVLSMKTCIYWQILHYEGVLTSSSLEHKSLE